MPSLLQNMLSRRQLLKTGSCGFGYLAFAGLASRWAHAELSPGHPLAARMPHVAPRAKRVIFMFMQGGPSQLETFDYQPDLQQHDGQSVTGEYFGQNTRGEILAGQAKFQACGESGLMMSEHFPHLSRHADDLCLLNAMHTDSPAHPQASIMLHTGSINFVRPSLGSWIVYGLGTENEDLPGFVTINPTNGVGGAQNYGSAFLPASFQGTRLGSGRQAMANIRNASLSTTAQRRQLDLIQSMNQRLLAESKVNSEIEGVIESYELAFRMQTAIPEVMDINDESRATKLRYGINSRNPASSFGLQCLMARRLAEAGVRFIEINRGGWDQHNNLRKAIARNCLSIDQPIAALISDLKSRGMLEETLLVWGGEFGRTPQGQGTDGRRHNNRGYSMWMAGGGIRGGQRYGVTDAISGVAAQDKVHTHDLHATILNLLGLDHQRLTYRYAGRDFRLTDVYGNVVSDIIV